MEPTPPPEPGKITVPQISTETRDRVIEIFGLDKTQKDRGILDGITGRKTEQPGKAVLDDSLEVWGDVARINRNVATGIQTVFTERRNSGPNLGKMSEDSILAGMAFVLRVYDFQSNNQLLDNFNRLDTTEIEVIQEIIRESISVTNKNVLDQALSQPRIPSYYIDLNQLINTVLQNNSQAYLYGSHFRVGAAVGFGILERVGGKLLPQQKPPEPSSPEDPDLPQP